jgi:WD40 repeat protein
MQSGKAVLTIEADGVNSIALSPDGKWLATGSYDKTAKIWDTKSGKIAMIFAGHQEPILSVAFSPDGKWLATGSRDKTAKIWDMQSGKIAFTLEGHQRDVSCVAISPDSKWLATGSVDGTVKIWELTAQGCLRIVSRLKKLSGLTLEQLKEYGLYDLLDLKPDNEIILLATASTWQIAAFADLYAEKITKSLPKKSDYERAKRLYIACLASEVDNEYFEQKIAELERVWQARGGE